MKTQTKITLLLFLLTALFVSGLLFLRRNESHREELLLKSSIYDKNTLYDKIERLEEASLYVFTYDYSNRDDMVTFVDSRGQSESGDFIDATLPSFNVNSTWIYDTRYRPVYAGSAPDSEETSPLPASPEFFRTLFSRSYFCHFFMMTDQGLMEIRGAPIQPAADRERSTAPRGYLFAGRLWNRGYIERLASLTESDIRVLPLSGQRPRGASYDYYSGVIGFSRAKFGWDKRPVAQVLIETKTPITKKLHTLYLNQLILLSVFVFSIIVLLTVLLIAWVTLPLNRISQSLHREAPGLLQKLQHSQSEFGNLARLILRFFRQKEELTREIGERQKAESALQRALDESRRSGSETAALLEASRAVLAYHNFQLVSEAIVAACTQLSTAAAGFIAEIADTADGKMLAYPPLLLPLEGLFKQAFSSGRPQFCNGAIDLAAAVDLLPPGHLAFENMLCAPLSFKGRPAAMLSIFNKPGGFTDNDARMAAAFSELASVALLNSKTLESLESSEERFRSVVQTAGDAIITVNSEGNIIFWNPGAEKTFGYRADQVLQQPAIKLLPERFGGLYQNRVQEIIKTGIPDKGLRPMEMVGLRRDGTEFPLELSQAMWQTQEGIFFTAIARDITSRKLAEDDLRKSEQRFRDIVENSLTGIFIIQNQRIVYRNQGQTALLDALPDSFNFSGGENIHPEDAAKVRLFHEDITSGRAATRDVDFRLQAEVSSQGPTELRWVNCRGALIEFQGAPALFVNMMDITRIMELEHLVRMQDKMASLGRVAAGIAHEIRNPLSGINSYLYTLKKIDFQNDSDNDRAAVLGDVTAAIQKASKKIEAVIRRVMDFSKPGLPRLTRITLAGPIQEVVNLSAVTLRKSGIVLEKELPPDLPDCYADIHMLEQVLLNLINNAVQALHDSMGEKKIMIRASYDEDAIAVAVADSGSGIPPEEREKIFDPFYTTKADGAGIGLSLCQRIIADHGGTIKVGDSALGGAEFRIELPRNGRTAAEN